LLFAVKRIRRSNFVISLAADDFSHASSVVKRKCGAVRPPNNWRSAGCGRVAGAISVTRTLIYFILKYYTVKKKTEIP